MPLLHEGFVNLGRNIDYQLAEKIDDAFKFIDKEVAERATHLEIPRKQLRMLKPLHFLVLVFGNIIIVVLSPSHVGATVIHQYQNWEKGPINLPTAMFLAERDLDFENTFGFEIPLSVLDYDDKERESELREIVQRYIEEEQQIFDRMKKLVKISPIFSGREFFVKENLVFVLSPFCDPFDTIFSDHIRPKIEQIGQLTCLRADDIYDNQPIIEDIWQHINEARLVIAELTGRNANVFYETGISHTVGKDVILITQSMDDVPFDLRHLRCIVYDYTPKGIKNLEKNLENTIINILSKR